MKLIKGDTRSSCNVNKFGKIGIIGVGNIFMGDDGVGIVLLQMLRKKSIIQDISLVDVGNNSLNLLHAMAKLDTVIIIDAVDFGGLPGEVRLLKPDALKSTKQIQNISTHESDILNIIELSRELGECPKTVLIFAIQPESLDPSLELSPRLKSLLPMLADQLIEVVLNINSTLEEEK